MGYRTYTSYEASIDESNAIMCMEHRKSLGLYKEGEDSLDIECSEATCRNGCPI